MIVEFDHSVINFTPEGILMAVGADPAGPLYYHLVNETRSIIETQALVTAETLNGLLKRAYFGDMMSIPEYANYPAYYDVMENALSQPYHIGFYWDNVGKIQARFVDVPALGDTRDLVDIQKIVHPGGTLRGWIIIYMSWISGESRKYESIVNARLDLMRGAGIAPFCEIIELGNGHNAYPQHSPRRTLTNFKVVYDEQMRVMYQRTLAIARMIIKRPSSLFTGYGIDSVFHNDKEYHGYSWKSQKGNTVFSIAGTTKIDRVGRVTGRGFIVSTKGEVLRKWSGLLPF